MPDMGEVSMDPTVERLAVSLGEWFAVAIQRTPTQEEINMATYELGQMPMPCSPDDVLAAMDRLAAKMRVSNPARDGRLL